MKKVFMLLVFLAYVMEAKAQWVQYILPLAPNEDLYGISFLNDSSYYVASNTRVSFTSNNAVGWSVYNPTNGYLTNTLQDIYFNSISSGIITGVFDLTNDEIVAGTNTGCASWAATYTNNIIAPPVYFNALDHFNSNVLVCGAKGRIISSSNNGFSFVSVNSTTTNELFDLKYTNSSNVICAGTNILLRSANGGSSWTPDNTYSGLTINSISAPGSGVVFMSTTNNKIFSSLNSGTSFTPINISLGSVNTIAAKNKDTVFIGTTQGIYVSLNGGVNWQQFKSTKTKYVTKIEIYKNRAFAMCKGKCLLILDLGTMQPEPLAQFTCNINAQCGVTNLTTNNFSDPADTFQWFINGTPVATTYNYSANYFSAVGNETVTLVVTNTNGTDTLKSVQGIIFRQPTIASAGPDVFQCYGQPTRLFATYYSGQTYDWRPHANIDAGYSGWWRDSALTQNLTANTQIILKTTNGDSCHSYDTVNIYIGNPINTNFVYTDPLVGGGLIYDLNFVSDSVGFGLSNGADFIKTTNGGNTWVKTHIVAGYFNNYYGGISFLDDSVGYLTNPTMKTINGGQTFTSIPLAASDVSFINRDTGVFAMVGQGTTSNYSYIYKTTDGASTLTKIYDYSINGLFCIVDVKMLNANVIYACGGTYDFNYYGLLKRSINGGATWTTIPNPSYSCILKVEAVSVDTVFILSLDNFVYRTHDGGITWTKYYVHNNSNGPFRVIKMLNSMTGYLGVAPGEIYKTNNGGDCWTKIFTSPYLNEMDALTVSPSGNSVYYAASAFFSGNGPVVYYTKNYRWLSGTLDNITCAMNNISTHNHSFGYTNYQWYLDNQLYATKYDTSFWFASQGTHQVKLQADSAGFFTDSLVFTLVVKPPANAMGVLSGINSICVNPSINTNTWASFSVTADSSFAIYNWFTDNPSALQTGVTSTTNNLTVAFTFNTNTIVHFYVFAQDTSGCFSQDTAVITVHTRTASPGDPAILTTTPPLCRFLDSTSFNSNLPLDSIYCTTTPGGANVDFYVWSYGAITTLTPAAYVPVYGWCLTDQYVLTIAYGNACGTSVNPIIIPYGIYYPIVVTHTPDTLVTPLTPAALFVNVQEDPSLQANGCTPIPVDWYRGGTHIILGNSVSFSSVTSADTGTYSAFIYNGCDTLKQDIKLNFIPAVGIKNNSSGFSVGPNPFSDKLFLNGNVEAINYVEITNVNGQVVQHICRKENDLSISIDPSLKPGIYFQQYYDKSNKLIFVSKAVKE